MTINYNFYIFGTPGDLYNQYPDDYTAPVIAGFMSSPLKSRLVIHRDHNLIHYIFAEKITDKNYVGICVIFNDAKFTKPKSLLNLFHRVITDLIIKSECFLRYDEDGELRFNVSAFSENIPEYQRIKAAISAEFMSKSSVLGFTKVTDIYNGIKSSETTTSSATDEQIMQLTSEYNTVIIDDSTTINDNYIQQIILNLRNQIAEANYTITELSEEIEELNKEKKQYKVVMLLGAVLLACCAGLWFFFDKLNITESELADAQSTINVQSDSIQMKNGVIDEMYEEKANLTRLYNQERAKLRLSQDSLSAYKKALPNNRFTITSTSFNFSSGYYTINYYGLEYLENLEFVVRVFDDNGSLVKTSSLRQNIYSGANSFDFYINRNLNYNRWYTFVILQGNRVVGGRKH